MGVLHVQRGDNLIVSGPCSWRNNAPHGSLTAPLLPINSTFFFDILLLSNQPKYLNDAAFLSILRSTGTDYCSIAP